MRGIVIDPRGRLRRSRFLWDLIMPNILAGVAVVALRMVDGPVAELGIGAIALLLLWSANFAAPITRLHDLGVSGWVHAVAVLAIFLFGTIGPVAGPGEAVDRLAAWVDVLRSGDDLPTVEGDSARIAGLIALIQIAVLAFVPGQSNANRFGPNPKAEA
ncbi:DUF805 domain-containing protein [Parvularcula maris]|uniref:DUF805 domain-containing protein n=1 Tax=Parvularcula maris TaxID=2965077 RepID=A0A9X2L758_9PROT|nr:DUF805 domain-containing protein [Parvularcula maris]MCQ8184414.1 DUF805 domain-containing protein [Parvularcula maris]